MSKIKSALKQPILLFYICVFLIMFIFTSLTPLVSDDFYYSYNCADGSPMVSLSQIIPSMAAHRQIINGRVVVHGVVQLFLMLPKPVFNIINALNAVFIIQLMLRFVTPVNNRSSLLLSVCAALLIWNMVPMFGETFLWLDGSINYSWAMSLLLLFLLPYCRAFLDAEYTTGKVKRLLFLPLSFIAGTCGESYSPACIMIATSLSLLRMSRDRKLPRRLSRALRFPSSASFFCSAPLPVPVG